MGRYFIAMQSQNILFGVIKQGDEESNERPDVFIHL